MAQTRPAMTWRDKPMADLTSDELVAAMEFNQVAASELRGWAPPHIWSFFATALSDLTIEQARRSSAGIGG